MISRVSLIISSSKYFDLKVFINSRPVFDYEDIDRPQVTGQAVRLHQRPSRPIFDYEDTDRPASQASSRPRPAKRPIRPVFDYEDSTGFGRGPPQRPSRPFQFDYEEYNEYDLISWGKNLCMYYHYQTFVYFSDTSVNQELNLIGNLMQRNVTSKVLIMYMKYIMSYQLFVKFFSDILSAI